MSGTRFCGAIGEGGPAGCKVYSRGARAEGGARGGGWLQERQASFV